MTKIPIEDKKDKFRFYWKVCGGEEKYTVVEEFPFSAIVGRKHRFDFAFTDKMVAVEIDGNAWNVKGGGKHMQDSDLEKLNLAVTLGWRVFRFSPKMLVEDPVTCMEIVLTALSI